jgi:hypothetical protein
MVNLAGMTAFAEVAADLRARLLRWIARIEDGQVPEIVPAPERASRQYRAIPRMLKDEYERDSRLGMNPGD